MSGTLAEILEDADYWLAQQPVAEEDSAEWYAHYNFRSFLNALSENAPPAAIDRACFVIRRHISDQFDWDTPYSKAISTFVEKVDRYAREAAWQRSKNEPDQ